MMKTKKIPMRMCLGCGEMKPKRELIRVVKSKEGDISLDLTGKKSGRGAYICKSVECFEKARKARKETGNDVHDYTRKRFICSFSFFGRKSAVPAPLKTTSAISKRSPRGRERRTLPESWLPSGKLISFPGVTLQGRSMLCWCRSIAFSHFLAGTGAG